MARRQVPDIMQVDTTALPRAAVDGLIDYNVSMGTVRASDLIQEFNGNKSELIQALAGTSDKSSTAYKSQAKNVSRWMSYEAGNRGTQARNPNNKRAQEKLRATMAQKRPPNNANISITGWVGYDGQWRYRSIGSPKPIHLAGSTLASFMDALSKGNTEAAYQSVMAAYGAPMLLVGADNPQISITFTP